MVKSQKKSKKKQLPAAKTNTKEEKLLSNYLKTVEQFVLGKSFRPMSKKELFERLKIHSEHSHIFDEVIEKLTTNKTITFKENLIFNLNEEQTRVKGTIRVNHRGFGFVQLEDKSQYSEDIFIPKQFTNNAVDGDIVEVEVNPNISKKGPEGKVWAISSRATLEFGGTILSKEPSNDWLVYSPMLGSNQKAILTGPGIHELKIGDRVLMEIIQWGEKESPAVCKLKSLIGNVNDPRSDIPAAILEFNLREKFSSKQVLEAEKLGKRVSPKEIAERKDFRNVTAVTIDPDTAKDFDDAITISKDRRGNFELIVHIADVSHYVQKGSQIDIEASKRCNSTYFPGKCIPMLPKELSENLCSLKAGVNRLTVSVSMSFDKNGELKKHKIYKAVIKSAKRFTYRQAKDILDGKTKSVHKDSLVLMTELCALLKAKRKARGSIEFSLPELVVLVDKEGHATGTDYVAYDITHQMIEEFMLKANETIAKELVDRGKNLTFRVHETPAEENLRDFAIIANSFGFKLPDLPTSFDIQDMFAKANDTEYASYLASNYIRKMRLATYSPDNIGHYGLSLEFYCHFTSPIRRYVDLVVHRILFGGNDDLTYLQETCQNCSDQERVSAKAEMSVVLLKKLRLLEQMVKDEPYRNFEAVITKVKNFGFYFEIIDLFLEGFIHISDIGEDFYIFEEAKMRLKGTREGSTYSPGAKISVILQGIDLILRETKWYLVPDRTKSYKAKVKESKKSSPKRPVPKASSRQELIFGQKKAKKRRKK